MVMEMYGVLTGDIVGSRNINPVLLEQQFGIVSREIEKVLFRRKKTFELYRGDSFQCILPPAMALRVALLWRSAMRAVQVNGVQWDVRIAIGLDSVAHMGAGIGSSSGAAFEHSGLLLEQLKQKNLPRIGIQSFDEAWNRQLETECILADALMQRWTPGGATGIYTALLYNETQERLAARLEITQSAVHKRLNAANWSAIRHWEHYFSQQVLSYLKSG